LIVSTAIETIIHSSRNRIGNIREGKTNRRNTFHQNASNIDFRLHPDRATQEWRHSQLPDLFEDERRASQDRTVTFPYARA